MSDPELCFVDSNIWLYALLVTQDQAKSKAAQQLLNSPNMSTMVSTQVINEVSSDLLKKANFSEERIRQLVASFYSRYLVVTPNQTLLTAASNLREQYSLSYWDSLIAAAAVYAGATTLYTEDFHTGLIINNQVTVKNPLLP